MSLHEEFRQLFEVGAQSGDELDDEDEEEEKDNPDGAATTTVMHDHMSIVDGVTISDNSRMMGESTAA